MPVPQPGLDFKERHRLTSIEELRSYGAPGTVTGDSSADVFDWNARFGTQRRDQHTVEVVVTRGAAMIGEQVIDLLTSLGICELRLSRAVFFPDFDHIADTLVDWL